MVLAFCLYVTVGLASGFATKNCSVVIGGKQSRHSTWIYMILQSLIACLFYWGSGGFRLEINGISLLFAAGFSVLCIASLLLSLRILHYFTVAEVNVVGSIGGMLLTAALGILLFSEALTWHVVIKCLLMTAAVLLSLLPDLRRGKGKRQKIWMLFCQPLLTALVWILQKGYVACPGTVSDSSFCFFTNVFIVLAFGIRFAAAAVTDREGTVKGISVFRGREIAATAACVLSANIIQLLQLYLLTKIDVILFSPISSALGLIYSGIVSLCYREELKWNNYAAVLFSIAVLFL